MTPRTDFRDVVVIGGGCYGSFYAGQLAEARTRGKITFRRVILVDRDPACQAVRSGPLPADFSLTGAEWNSFLDEFLNREPPPDGSPDDAIVPSPLMPHLMAHWLQRLTGRHWPGSVAEAVAVDRPLGTPYDVLAPDGTRYVSFADWLCPTHCIEPHRCPVIRGPRTWEMKDALAAYVARLDRDRPTAGPALFVTRHRAFGVGMFDVAEAREARTLLGEAVGRGADLVMATVSACHGAVGMLRVTNAGRVL
ncbi:MAG: hypothetical protein EXR94_12115 [Gemmatimonadetes bacterium]|nr:hypothetical protein [Gemmatimonadota bacterium]